MKVVVIGTRGFPNVQGGVEKHCEELYPRLAAFGVDVTVITRRPYGDPSLKEYRGVKLIAVDCPKQKFLEAFVHSFKALFVARKLNPDIVHIHAVGPNLITPFARLLGLKVVMTHHGPDYERKKWNMIAKLVLRVGEACGCLFANRVVAIADNIADSVRKKFGKEAQVIPNGVILPGILPSGGTLKRYGLEAGRYFLAVGRFVPEKGFHDLLEAYAPIGSATWKLVIVGDADHEDDYSRKLKARAKEIPGVVMTGFLTGDPLREIYSSAGMFVLPSYYEGLPIVLLEALSYGLSCVVSDIPANRCVTLDAQRYFAPGDVAVLAKKLQHFSQSPLTPDQKASQIEYIRANFDWDAVTLKTLEIYKNI